MRASHILVCGLLALSLVVARGRSDAAAASIKSNEDASTGLWCKTCNAFVTVLDRVLEMQEVQDWLDEYIEGHVCPLMPESLVEECMKDVPQVVPAVIDFLEGLASSTLCSGMGVCAKQDLQAIAFHEQQMSMNKASNEDKQEMCDVCRQFTAVAEEQVDSFDPMDVMKWKSQLDRACESVPENMREKCKSLVDRYSYLLMYYLTKEKDEGNISKVCEDLNICPSEGPSAVPPLQLSLVKKMAGVWIGVNEEDSCQKCVEIAKRTEGSLAEEGFSQEIGDYIVRVCRYVPPIRDECTEALRTFSDRFFGSLLKVIAPEAICSDFGFCGEGDVPSEVQFALDLDTGFNQKIVYVH